MDRSKRNASSYIYIGVAVFILMLITGWISGVTPSVLLVRAVLAAVFFAVVSWWIFTFIIKEILTPPVQNQVTEEQPEADDQPVRGTKLDITLPAEEPDTQEAVFKPLAPHQIDPQLNRIIGEDPERVASLVEKMGLK